MILRSRYLKDNLTLLVSAGLLRSPGEDVLPVPPLAVARLWGAREKAPRVWIRLPWKVHLTLMLDVFRENLKTEFNRQAFGISNCS